MHENSRDKIKINTIKPQSISEVLSVIVEGMITEDKITPAKEKYFLIDMERTISTGLIHYWKAGGWGYTPDINKAGHYSEEEAASKVASDMDNLTYGIQIKKALKLTGLK